MRRRALVAASIGALAAACGIDALGSLVVEPPSERGEGDEGGVDAASLDAGSSDAADATVEAEAAPRCDASVVVVDPLDALDGGTWIVIADTTNVGYPAVETTGEGPAVGLVNDAGGTNLGALYLAKPIPIRAFDVKVRSIVTCPDGGGCSDGLAFTWLATDAGAAALQSFVSTPTFGIPPFVAGAGVAFDLQTDLAPNDPAAPSVSLLSIDGVGAPGAYDWHTKSAPAPTFAGSRDITLALRKGHLTVRVDGAPAIDGPVDAGFTGYFGMSASNGLALGRFALKSFRATFYECEDP